MNRIDDKYIAFEKNINNVVQFIDFIEMQEEEISNPHALKLVREVTHSSVPYNAMIISLYGNVELFIDEIAEAYIDKIYKLVGKYSKLPKKMREKHEMTSGEYLYNSGRFNNYDITIEEVVSNLNECLQGKANAKMNMKMLLKHGGNLRSEQIFKFFIELGVENIKARFLQNETTVNAYANQKGISFDDAKARLSAQNKEESSINYFEELDNLVEQRNQVAHSGRVDEKKSLNYIKENTVPFLLLFGKVISEILINDILKLLIDKNMVVEFPIIKDVFNSSIIWLELGDNSLSVGDKIIYTNGQVVGYCKIVSIRVDNKDVSMVESSQNREVTIGVDKKIKKNWKFFKYMFV